MSTYQKADDSAVQGAVSRERRLPSFRSALPGHETKKWRPNDSRQQRKEGQGRKGGKRRREYEVRVTLPGGETKDLDLHRNVNLRIKYRTAPHRTTAAQHPSELN